MATSGGGSADGTQQKPANRLADEESPYLLQHAHNPVDWYPWGEEAFEKARKEEKPIFLSVGYSTCHWCHVMERESFESEAVAALMNDGFVNIKVDREERPDVDKVYMTFVQASTGQGGWPMSVWLSPDLKPFVGGTYFPPNDKYGRPGFVTVLRRIADLWRDRRDDLKSQSAEISMQLQEALEGEAAVGSAADRDAQALAPRALELCAKQLRQRFDAKHGGFGGAPKFPRPSEINALLAQHVRIQMAETSLERMAAGGMWDHIGGGFHRYSVDELWHVPHFEKMLYDNPQLALTYLDAFLLTGKAQYADVARGILDYLRRDMTHPEGGIYAAEDADSLNEASGRKEEGAFYVWEASEIEAVLGGGSEAAHVLLHHYGVRPEGNCTMSPRSDPHREFQGKNCLIQMHTVEETAAEVGVAADAARSLLALGRQALHKHRARRPRPSLDNKVVAAWNGMAISAFARASAVLRSAPEAAAGFPVDGCGADEYLEAARRAAAFAKQQLWQAEDESGQGGRLVRSVCRQPSRVAAFSDDYAHMVAGLLDLYEATAEVQHLQWALQLQAVLDAVFWDADAYAYWQTSGQDRSILYRMKEDYDGAEPAASSIAVANLIRLAGVVGREQGEAMLQRAEQAVLAFSGRLKDSPIAMPQMCAALARLPPPEAAARQVILAGSTSSPDLQQLMTALHSVFSLHTAVILIDPSDADSAAFWRHTNPDAMAVVDAAAAATGTGGASATTSATAFVCQNYTCQAPTSDAARLRELLQQPAKQQPSGGPSLEAVDLSGLLNKPPTAKES